LNIQPDIIPGRPSIRTVRIRTLLIAVLISLLVGAAGGFLVGLGTTRVGRNLIRGLVENEQPAKISSPRTHDRAKFSFQYPSNWTIDTKDEDYDPDRYLSVESPGTAYVTFWMDAKVGGPELHLKSHVEALTGKLMTGATITPFDKFGAFTGTGAILHGKVLGLMHTVKVFSARKGEMVFVISQHGDDEDLPDVQPAFDLIERTLSIKNAATQTD
jgi:hypothetical protein